MNNDRIYYSHDAETQAKRETATLTLFALTVGLGVGALVTLFFAPKPGKSARQELVRNIEGYWKAGRDAVDPMVKRFEQEVGGWFKSAKERATYLT